MAAKKAATKKKPQRADDPEVILDATDTDAETDQRCQVIGDGGQACAMPAQPPRSFSIEMHPGRERAIVQSDQKWVSGTVLRFHFFDEDDFPWDRDLYEWGGNEVERQVVREAFDVWASLGIGIEFVEVDQASEAEIRIGFVHGDGAWSWLGRRILQEPTNARTMNFGWSLVGDIDTAVHEIGHTLAMPHEHQNPFSGIVWNEPAVYAELGGPPNNWPAERVHYNVLRKLPASSVTGSAWDRDSVMHYGFAAGLILEPEEFANTPLIPAPGLSDGDATWVRKWYPKVEPELPKLTPFEIQRVSVGPGEQAQFDIEPDATRTYHLVTFGEADTVMVLFEEVEGEWRFHSGDDDSGAGRNAELDVKLFAGRKYQVRLRLYWAGGTGDFGVFMW